jgi:hypothetical protein
VTFNDGAQAYIDIYDSYLTGSTWWRAAQFDVRITDNRSDSGADLDGSVRHRPAGSRSGAGLGLVRRRCA